jgi:hypothetical protein
MIDPQVEVVLNKADYLREQILAYPDKRYTSYQMASYISTVREMIDEPALSVFLVGLADEIIYSIFTAHVVSQTYKGATPILEWSVRPEVLDYLRVYKLAEELAKDDDEEWVEFVLLVEKIKEEIPYTPFQIVEDDFHYLVGAVDIACNDLKLDPKDYGVRVIDEERFEVYNVRKESDEEN